MEKDLKTAIFVDYAGNAAEITYYVGERNKRHIVASTNNDIIVDNATYIDETGNLIDYNRIQEKGYLANRRTMNYGK